LLDARPISSTSEHYSSHGEEKEEPAYSQTAITSTEGREGEGTDDLALILFIFFH
jgi:hypothetical protein